MNHMNPLSAYHRTFASMYYSKPVSVLTAMTTPDCVYLLGLAMPGKTREEHMTMGLGFLGQLRQADHQWKAEFDRAFLETFGRASTVEDGRLYGLGREEFSQEARARLRGISVHRSHLSTIALTHLVCAGFDEHRAGEMIREALDLAGTCQAHQPE